MEITLIFIVPLIVLVIFALSIDFVVWAIWRAFELVVEVLGLGGRR